LRFYPVPKLTLRVNQKEFGGWKKVQVTRGIESISGSFELEVSDRWGEQLEPWAIGEEDECELVIDGVPVITGYVDRRSISYSASEHTLNVSGRDKTGALVDCSAYLEKWEFQNTPVLTLAERICEPFGITVTLQAGTTPPATPAKLSIDPGDSAFEAIERSCRMAGLLPVADGVGGLVLTRAGETRALTELIEGQNILAASANYDATGRYRNYYVLGQHRGTDEHNGTAATEVKAFAEDENVKRVERVLLIRPEGNVTVAHAKKRAEWEAIVRASRADAVTITVQGWTQGDGTLWPVNSTVKVLSPLLGINGRMLITEVTYSLDEAGMITRLTLKRPDAFLPEATVPLTTSGSNYWKELVGGV
jgi:prophage tail gpP-like protein